MSKGIVNEENLIATLQDKLDAETTSNLRMLIMVHEIQRQLSEEEIQKYCYDEITRADIELFLASNNVNMDRNLIPTFLIKILRRFSANLQTGKELR